jgi:hypothetical protein
MKTYEDSEKSLIQFVETQIALMKENLLWSGQEPTFYMLNTALSNYETVALGLTSLYSTVRAAHDFAQEKYDDFYAAKFVAERQGRASLKKDYMSTKEVEMLVRVNNMKELAALKAEVLALDTKRSFVERLVKGWDNYAFVLNTLSKNAQSEMSAGVVASKNPVEFGDE